MSLLRRRVEEVKSLLKISRDDLREVVAFFIAYANTYLDLSELRRRYNIEENRSALIRILTGEGRREVVGVLLTSDNKVEPYTGREEATVVITLDEDTFWAIVAGKIESKRAWALGLIDVDGENPIRDALILLPVVDAVRSAIARGRG